MYDDYLSKFYGSKDLRNFEGNHDSDEIENDADQTGWIKLSTFITEFMGRNDETLKLSRMCDITPSNYILDNVPFQVVIEKINSNMYSTKQSVNLLENFV